MFKGVIILDLILILFSIVLCSHNYFIPELDTPIMLELKLLYYPTPFRFMTIYILFLSLCLYATYTKKIKILLPPLLPPTNILAH